MFFNLLKRVKTLRTLIVVKMIVVVSLFLSACMVGPDFKEPQKNVTPHWLNKESVIKETPFRDTQWWAVFHDKNLTELIQLSYCNNLSLQIAGVRVLQARAQLAQSVGELYPQQQALTGSYNYNRIGGGSLQNLLPPSFDTASLGLSANWEIDFWGKYRRAIQSNDAAFLAYLAAYDNGIVSLTADVAAAYIKIRTDQALIRVTKENIQLQKMSLKLAKSRFKAGQTSLLDVDQAQTELAQTEASLPQYVSDLRTQKDALGLLLGTTPNQVDGLLKKNKPIPKAPLKVAVGIPIETLDRRPDIHQARLEAIAQSEAIGAAKANLYPSFSLLGTFAFASNNIPPSSIGNIFNWSNRTITAGPSVNWPLLNYGQITNTVRIQDAAFQQALLSYINQVLHAQQEVQDSITRYIESNKSERDLTRANQSAVQSTRLSLIRYREGEADYTTVLDVEQQQLRVQTSLENAKGGVALALVSLYRALGGGWQIRNGNDIVSNQTKMQMAARTNWGGLLKQQNHQAPQTQAEKLKQMYLPDW
jgi:NodT family efflux transporter outer membrane factor (OMF) lipoprotein